MSKSWLHPNRPNVPQPPFNLQPDVPLRSPRSQTFTVQRSELPYSPHMGAGGVPMQRSAAMVPPVPKVPARYTQQDDNYADAKHTSARPPSPSSPAPAATTAPLRRMTQEERTAYIQEVDRAHAAAAQAALKPLQLASSATVPTAPLTPPLPPTPPEDDEALRAYMQKHYSDKRPEAVDTPSDVEPEAFALDDAATVAPAPERERETTPTPPAATYASTAGNVGSAHRVPATRTYSIGGTPQDAGATTAAPQAPAAAPAAPVALAAEASTVPEIVVPPTANSGRVPAVIEVFSNGQVVARISLPWAGYGAV